MEIEAKYAIIGPVSPETLDQLDLAPYTLRPGEDLEHHDILLDTPERTITGSRHSLRVRDENGHKILTLKGPGTVKGSIHQREELEAPLPEAPAGEFDGEHYDYTAWPSEIAAPVAQMAGLHPLAPLVEMRVHRRTWIVERAGRQIGELALDEGTIEANGATRPVHELELELKGAGTERDLRALDGRLRERLPLEPETRSKLERGLELLDSGNGTTTGGAQRTGEPNGTSSGPHGEGARAVPTQDEARDQTGNHQAQQQAVAGADDNHEDRPTRWLRRISEPSPDEQLPDEQHAGHRPGHERAMTGHTPLQIAARHVVKRYLIKLRKHEPGVRSGDDPEDVHDMRVAARRIRSALALLEEAPSFHHKRMRTMRRHLRNLSHGLGAVRDLDVFLKHLKEYEQAHPDERAGLGALRRELERRREAARAKLLHELGRGKLEHRLHEVEAFATHPVDLSGEERPVLVRHFVGGAIWERYEDVLRYECELPGAAPPELHQLRIACKRLRYAIEMFEPALGERAKPILEVLVAVQDHLGALQDTVVALATVQELRGDERDHDHHHPHDRTRHRHDGDQAMADEERVALGSYADALALHRDELKVSFAPLWTEISDERFRASLAELIAEL